MVKFNITLSHDIIIITAVPLEPAITSLVECDSDSDTLTQFFNLTWDLPTNIQDFSLSHFELEIENGTKHTIGKTERFYILSLSSKYVHTNKILKLRLAAVSTCGKSGRTSNYSVPLSIAGSFKAKNESTDAYRTAFIVVTVILFFVIIIGLFVKLMILVRSKFGNKGNSLITEPESHSHNFNTQQ